MEKVKILLSQLLPLLKDNTLKTGDPLGIKTVYWTDWAKDFNLPRRGETIILTGRMYQMFPYITQATSLLASTERFLSRKVLGGIIRRGSKLVGEKAIVWGARKEEDLIAKSERTLCGIVKALLAIGLQPAYLYEDEPYSGALLYDLGLDEFLPGHINKVYRLLKERGAKEVIGVDPHTVLMLKEVYPRYISDYDLKVRHYLEVLAENENELRKKQKGKVEGNFVIHDSCVMAKN